MIRCLRRVHGAAALGGLLFLPPLIVLGLSARRELPRQLQGPWDGDRGRDAGLTEEGALQWAISVGDDGRSLDLQPSRDLQEPDVLVYWSPGVGPFDAIPEDAILLGLLAGAEARRFEMPDAAQGVADASILVYSLARAELLTTLRCPKTEANR